MSIMTLIRAASGSVAACWIIYIGYLFVAHVTGRELGYSPLRAAVMQILGIATVVVLVAWLLRRTVRRLEKRLERDWGRAVELGRRLERVRDQRRGDGVVVALRDRFSDRPR